MPQRPIQTHHFLRLRQVRSYRKTPLGMIFDVDEEKLRVEVLRDDVIRLKISHAGRFDDAPTFAVAFREPHESQFEVRESDTEVEISTQRMRVVVRKSPFDFAAYRSDGSTLFESSIDHEGPEGYQHLNDRFVLSRRSGQFDAIYGLGEKAGAFNRRGRQWTNWSYDIMSNTLEGNRLDVDNDDFKSPTFDPYYMVIPFFYHCAVKQGRASMAGFFIDNGYKSVFDFSNQSRLRCAFEGGQYTEYVFAGPSMREVLEAYTWVTGRISLPPMWSLGYHQCRWHDYRQADIVQIGAEYRERKIPCDVLWLDIHYMDAYRVFTWDEAKFTDPAAMLGSMRENGFRAITIIDPGVKYDPGYSVFDEGREANLFCKTEEGQLYIGQVWPGRTVFPDFVKAETRSWWGRLNAEHVASGLAGIWNDMNEPATGDVDPFGMRFDRDGENYSHERYHNQYAMLMAMGTHEGLLKARPNERPFILSRAGFAGIQRFAANWMGDNCSRWEHLEMSMPMAAGLGVSGQPFVGADIPGFAETPTSELMVRWMQYGTLTPFARGHNCAGFDDQYPWSFGPAVERACRRAIELRYRLLPYLYTAFVKAAESGEPIQRPMLFDFQHDRQAREVDDQYMLGDALLVAPIFRPGVTARHVYLPPGTWVHLHTHRAYEGGQYCTVEAPAEQIPVFCRGGYVIAANPEAPLTTMGYYPECIELWIAVPDADGQFVSELQEDDGLTFNALSGARLRTRFVLERSGGSLRLTSSVEGAGFRELERKRFRVQFLNGAPSDASLDGAPVAISDGALTFDNVGKPFVLDVAV